jgi:hypothetical protein
MPADPAGQAESERQYRHEHQRVADEPGDNGKVVRAFTSAGPAVRPLFNVRPTVVSEGRTRDEAREAQPARYLAASEAKVMAESPGGGIGHEPA